MSSNISVVLPQILFAQSVREFVRKMARRILPGIALEEFQLESDFVFESSINSTLARLSDDATLNERRAAVVAVTFNDVNRLCKLLKNACVAVGLKQVAEDYLRYSYFSNFILSQDTEKMRLLMRIADNDDKDLVRVFFHIARILNDGATTYETLDYAAKVKATEDVRNLLGEVKGAIYEAKGEVKDAVAEVGEKVDAVAKRVSRKGSSRHDKEKVSFCLGVWSAAQKDYEFKYGLNTRLTHKAVYDRHKNTLEGKGITSVAEFTKIIRAQQAREQRQRMKALEAKGTCAGKGGNGIMRTMRNTASMETEGV